MIRYGLFFLLFSLVILLPGIRIAGKKQFQESPFDLSVTKGLTGYFSLCILFHHVAVLYNRYYEIDAVSFAVEQMGVLLVGFFFLFSGYGLIISCETKENYLKTFVIRRVCTVLLPFFICHYIYILTTLLAGSRYSMKELVLSFFGLILLNDQMWFAVEIMILYMAFFLIFRFSKNEKLNFLFMGTFVLGLIIFSFFQGHDNDNIQMHWFHGEWWYNTTLLFFIGMLLAKHREKLLVTTKKYYGRLLLVFSVLFLLLWKATDYMLSNYGYWTETPFDNGYADKILTLSVQLPMVITFELLLLLILLKVRIHNRFLTFLGKISLELVLLQNVFLFLFTDYFPQKTGLYLLATTVCTLFLAIIINKIKLLILEKK